MFDMILFVLSFLAADDTAPEEPIVRPSAGVVIFVDG